MPSFIKRIVHQCYGGTNSNFNIQNDSNTLENFNVSLTLSLNTLWKFAGGHSSL